MTRQKYGLTRRQTLSRHAFVGARFVIGNGFVAGKAEAANWAVEVEHLKPATMATLIQLARDIYPHDQVSDQFYAIAVKGYDTAQAAVGIEAGVAALDAAARGIGYANYIDIGCERDRARLLSSLEDTPFFRQIRAGLVTGLYNQQALWPLFGRAGFCEGGCDERAFGDINRL